MMSKKTIKWLTWTGIVMPIIFVFYFVNKYGFTVPFWDEWDYVILLEKFHNHTLTFTDMWVQHNEHRMFFTNIQMLFLANLSGWNIMLELYCSIIYAALSLYFLISLLDDTISSESSYILKIVISFLMFSMIQYENWSMGFSVQYYMAMTGVIVSIWSINKWQGQMRGLIIAVLASIFAIFSFGAGLFICPVILFMLIFQKKWKLKHILIWIATCFVITCVYYYNYNILEGNPSLSYSLSHPVLFIRYVLVYLGSPLGQTIVYSSLVTIILFVISVLAIFDIMWLDKDQLIRLIPWIALMIYTIICACVIYLGRINYGVHQALDSRYTTISTLFIISVIVLLYNSIILHLGRNKALKRNKIVLIKDMLFIVSVVLLFCCSYIKSYQFGMKEMKRRYEVINRAAVSLNDPENASDEDLKKLCWNPDIVRERMKILNELGIEFNKEK
ncbi:MAG: hypothetical protein JXA96_03795 [Sedimentisphaerales bacterium]|nr:hypothetical protein [Sedimentisphaerales bacterium]